MASVLRRDVVHSVPLSSAAPARRKPLWWRLYRPTLASIDQTSRNPAWHGQLDPATDRSGPPGRPSADWPRDTPGRMVDLIRDPSPPLSPRHISHQFSDQNPLSGWTLSRPARRFHYAAPNTRPTAYISDSYRRPQLAHFLHYIKPISRGLYVARVPRCLAAH